MISKSTRLYKTSGAFEIVRALVAVDLAPDSASRALLTLTVVTAGHHSSAIKRTFSVTNVPTDADYSDFLHDAGRIEAQGLIQRELVDPAVSKLLGPDEHRWIELADAHYRDFHALLRPDAARKNLENLRDETTDDLLRLHLQVMTTLVIELA